MTCRGMLLMDLISRGQVDACVNEWLMGRVKYKRNTSVD